MYILKTIKQKLLPIYNELIHRSRHLARLVEAIFRGRIERCSVCGRVGPLLYSRDIIAPELIKRWQLTPELVEAFRRKESLACGWCGASLRVRRLARTLLDLYPVGGRSARSISVWVRQPEIHALRVAEINGIAGLTSYLKQLPHHLYSEYQESPSAGIPHEDLTRLSYPDASFDLVLTSETLEHVPDLELALSEIRRILVPAGRHVFTIPWRPDILETKPRLTLTTNGLEIVTPPVIHHPGGDVGYPVFTEIGLDFADRMSNAGFSTTIHYGPILPTDVAQVFVCTKSAHNETKPKEPTCEPGAETK